ncbi:MAG: Wzz/FepE/Etk N-terminal domain-containing protein [Candidatus Hydrogenedentales bacterium]
MDNLALVAAQALYAQRRLIFIVTLVAALLAAIYVLLIRQDIYRATVMLVATSPLISGELGEQFAEGFNPKVYEEIMLSPTILEATRRELIREGIFGDEEPPRLEEFLKWVETQISIIDQTTPPISYSPIVRLRVRHFDPKAAEHIAVKWAEIGLEATQNANYLRSGAAVNVLLDQEDMQRQVLEDIWKQRQEVESDFNVETKLEELYYRVEVMTDLLAERVAIEGTIENAKAKLASLQASLTQLDPYLEVFRAPTTTAYWLMEGQQREQALEELKDKGMIEQEPNEVYWILKLDEQDAMATMAAETAKLESLNQQIEKLQNEQGQLQQDLSERQKALTALETREEVTKEVYAEIAGAATRTAIAATLVQTSDDREGMGMVNAVGLNRMSETVPVVRDIVIGGRATILLFTLLAFIVTCGVVAAVAVSQTLRDRLAT